MIKINLATKKQSGLVQSKPGLTIGRFDLSTLLRLKGGGSEATATVIQELPVRKIVLALVVGVLANYTAESQKEAELKKVQDQIDAITAQIPKLKADADKLKSYEELKKGLEQDEFTIKTKIDTIQKLIAGRNAPPKMLIAMSSSIPSEVWLSELKIQDANVSIAGYARDYTMISDFMKNLGESIYFNELSLKNSQQTKDVESGQEVASFELAAKRKERP